ncbi:hypothetical protein WR25_02160 [Diploscapter pachys]|uniref:Uncharacterized protein n=1 Tax=Diploscapter pachys TaxID=2018661 RepID=A0A2A2M299_9BILA|nr:hypothetical protein WR25_02160 [Diploscapter pachys]
MAAPGRRISPAAMPIDTETSVVAANRPTVRRPIDPSRRGSPSVAIPAAIVTSTTGTTSILIRRTNRSPISRIAPAPSGHSSPSATPRINPPTTRCHSGMANQPRIRRKRACPKSQAPVRTGCRRDRARRRRDPAPATAGHRDRRSPRHSQPASPARYPATNTPYSPPSPQTPAPAPHQRAQALQSSRPSCRA